MTLVHRLRDLYEASPGSLKRPLAAAARALPVRLRYGGAFHRARTLLAQEAEWDEGRLAEEQDRRLAALATAARRTPFWQACFDRAGMPDGPRDAAGLRRLPLLSKEQVRAEGTALLDPSSPPGARKWVTTGGTSGTPLGLWIDKDASVIDWAHVVDAWGRVGFRLDEPRVVLRGRRLGSRGRALFEYEPIRRELYVSTFDLDARHLPEIRRRIEEFGARFLHGYPSALEVLGRSYRQAGMPAPKLRALLCVSENLYPAQRGLLEQLFGCRVFSFYGMTEKGAFAAECEASTELHVDPLYGVVELVTEDGSPVEEPDVRGEIVVTGLVSRAMPLFRYRTGDFGAWSRGPCACGRPFRRLRTVEGRWKQEALVGREGARISMTALNVHSPVFDNAARFQFLQEIPGQAILLVEPSSRFSQADERAILAELAGKLSGQVALSLRVVDRIPQSPIGKQRFIDQRIAGAEWP